MTTDRAKSQLADRGQGRCAISGALTFESAPWLWKELQTLNLLTQAREADLSEVVASDSAGLALLVTWKAECAKQGGSLSFQGVPPRLVALARLTDAQGLLQPAA